MDVRETPVFRLDQMNLTVQGTVQVSGVGEYPLTEIALKDALQRGGLHQSSCENFFQEHNEELDQAIVNAANAYYAKSRYAGRLVKLITRLDENGVRITLGIPSAKYSLLAHEHAVEKILPHVSSSLKLSRCHVYPEFLEICFTDPIQTTRDAVGKIVELGLSFLNSQGTRTRALFISAFSLRLICSNGATAKDRVFSARYPHKGSVVNGELGERISEILQRFSGMMQDLPRLGSMAVTDKFLTHIRPDLTDALGTKGSDEFIKEVDRGNETVMQFWNRITSLPHRIPNPTTKLKLEQVGFKVLTAHLYPSY